MKTLTESLFDQGQWFFVVWNNEFSNDNLISFFIFFWHVCFMSETCENCGGKLVDPRLTHCSDRCLFSNIPSSARSLSEIPVKFHIWVIKIQLMVKEKEKPATKKKRKTAKPKSKKESTIAELHLRIEKLEKKLTEIQNKT